MTMGWCHAGRWWPDEFVLALEVTVRQSTGERDFDPLCASLGVEHQLTKSRTPRTNGVVDRFNGRIADVLRSHRFQSGLDLAQTLRRHEALSDHQLP
jgi:hypothetical protein